MGGGHQALLTAYDPFDLPDWLGTSQVTWEATTALTEGPHVAGRLTAADGVGQSLGLLAVDAAYPTAVCPEHHRVAAHRAWLLDEVALLEAGPQGVVAAVPGTRFDPDLACEAVRRVAKSVGATSGGWRVVIAL